VNGGAIRVAHAVWLTERTGNAIVCTESAYESEIRDLDAEIRRFANKRSPFSRREKTPTIRASDTDMVEIVSKEVETLRVVTEELNQKIDAIEKGVVAHKKEHMISWAKRGLPEDDPTRPDEVDDDFRGVRLGEAMEKVIKLRRDAIRAAHDHQAAKIPLIVLDEPAVEDVVSEEDLIALAQARRASES
jgi:hypothetical protein